MQIIRSKSDPVQLSVQLYQKLTLLYPSDFRREYAGPMVQVFRDSCLRANRGGKFAGLLGLWACTLADLLLSVIEQYSNRGAQMTKSRWIKLSGWMLASSSLLILVGWISSLRPDYSPYSALSWPIDRYLKAATAPVSIAAMLFILIGILGLRARYASQVRGIGQAGMLLSLVGATGALIGMTGMMLTGTGILWEVFMLGATVLFAGLSMFGVNCLTSKLLPRLNGLPLIISLPWLAVVVGVYIPRAFGRPFITISDFIEGTIFAFSFLGIALVGYLLQSDAAPRQLAAS